MICNNCGQKDESNSQFCMKCGQPLRADAAPGKAGAVRKGGRSRGKALPIVIAVSIILLAVIILILALSANPVAGRWYSQSGTELLLLENGKGMTIPADDTERFYFMYAIGYREAGYIEGEIYDKESGSSTWFYLYDGKLEFNGELFYRQKPSPRLG